MIDRTTLELRFDTHARMTKSINSEGWKAVTTIPVHPPRAALAVLLLTLAARLDPTVLMGWPRESLTQAAPR